MYFNRDPLVVRLGKLADSGQTGVLRLPGDLGGAIYLSEGDVVFAESKRTPGPASGLARQPGRPHEADPAGSRANRGGPADAVDPEIAGSLAWRFAVREATVDAALELLSSRPRHALLQRFRESGTPTVGTVGGMSLPALLTEVNRRQEIVKQMSISLTADTAVLRNPHIDSPELQVSELQWALLIRMRDRSTPRDLAWELGHSVFGTTVEVSQLIALGLVSVVGAPSPREPGEPSGPRRDTVSFLRALIG
ncbi:hypothetical protein N5079_00440 [Planotetraspora sp. A-T 1434]|uniref:hypothetical protein n=1 Tax=Planotetraspora sp. A-T 1434 TaxID=2979219 RepID=UPI0021BF20E4|nr:hypothetical protein [Planotetraspora sp. A-T 1434]MCT9928678.1 hypothetical protein [Planotetraspora sp. A-T 1434]